MNEDDVCLVNYATTHTIFRDKIYFLDFTLKNVNVSTISVKTREKFNFSEKW